MTETPGIATEPEAPAKSEADQTNIALDANLAVKFLKALQPNGPWALTAIHPETRKTYTRTFGPNAEGMAKKFIETRNGEWNLYFSVNPVNKAVTRKASKADIREVAFLHVDIDPDNGADIEGEQDRILSLLTDNLPKGTPEPTCILFSGGGYQAFWRLDEALPADDEAELYNKQLETVFGGDSCHNIDRVMRLPHTMNIPNAKKREKGRVASIAKVLDWQNGSHPISAFRKAAVQKALAQTSAEVDTTERRRIENVAELDTWNVPDRVKVVIVQGRDPERPKDGDNSRSAWLFDAVCQLVRCGVPDGVIYSIITDPDFGISESVVELGAKAEKYAIRQIEKAKEEVEDPVLAEMNQKYCVVVDGGQTRVLAWKPSEIDASREEPEFMSFESLRNFYMNRRVDVPVGDEVKRVPQGTWWLSHPMRRQFAGLCFEPKMGEMVGGRLNLWRGFAVQPAPGDWSLMQAHIRDVLASGNAEYSDYILRWAAWTVQNPDRPAEVALVFQGGQGTGKGMFARAVKELFGQHGLHVSSPGQVAGRFNRHLRDCCLLFADEAIAPGDKAAEGVLKTMLTERELPIEGKGVDIVQARNRLHVIMASNEDWVVPAGRDERRFAVFQVSDARAGDHTYFKALATQLRNGGRAAMLHDLLSMDIGDWHPRRNVPQTEALVGQKQHSLRGFKRWFYERLQEGAIPISHFSKGGIHCGTKELVETADPGNRDPECNNTSAGRCLSDLGFIKPPNGRPRGFILPPLPEARAAWIEVMGFGSFDEDITEWDDMNGRSESPF